MQDKLGREIVEGDKIAFISKGRLALGLVTATGEKKISVWPDGADRKIQVRDTQNTIVVTGGVRKALTITEILLTIREGITQVLQHEKITDRSLLGSRLGLDRAPDRHVPSRAKTRPDNVRRRGRREARDV